MRKYLLAALFFVPYASMGVNLIDAGVSEVNGTAYRVRYDRDSIQKNGHGARVTVLLEQEDGTGIVFNQYFDCKKNKGITSDTATIVFPDGRSRDIRTGSKWIRVENPNDNLVFIDACAE